MNSELDKWLKEASKSHSPAKAIIAPHAGYRYSGPCAAYAYKQIDPSRVKRVFIIGPSHHVYLKGCALSSLAVYETPLYDLPIDHKIYEDLKGTGRFEIMSQTVDEDEHSIEMHLPYVAKVMESRKGEYTIVPVLVGALKEDKEVLYGQILSKYLADPDNLFVISSDFCHWGSRFRYTHYDKSKGEIHQSIRHLDHEGMGRIEALDPRAFSLYLSETHNTICGRHPIAVLLNMIETVHNSTEKRFTLKFVNYAQSNQCKSMSDSSVSYASAAVIMS